MEDWRLTGQDKYMKNIELKLVKPDEIKKRSSLWHEHCEFCIETIDNTYKEPCYCSMDDYRWICMQCFNDFKDIFNWVVTNND